MADLTSRVLHARIPKTTDVEVHVSTVVTADSGDYFDIREYVVSLDQYGRGITLPLETDLLISVIDGLSQALPKTTAAVT